MTVRIATRADITLQALQRVAWDGEAVELAPEAIERMQRSHASFAALVAARVAEDPGALIYGTTTAPGDGAAVALTPEAQARRPTRLWTAHAFGEPLPDRVVRAIVLARLANFVDGHAAVRAEVATEVAGMLGSPLPEVPGQGNGGAGEIVALGRLFYDLSARLDLEPKERMALINGSPCAAALVADVALAGQARLALAESVFALTAEAAQAPLEAYSEDLEAAVGRRARDGRAAFAARAARRFGRRPPGAPGRGQLPHPAAGARPGAPRAGRGRARRRRCRCARSPTTRSTSCPTATARSGP